MLKIVPTMLLIKAMYLLIHLSDSCFPNNGASSRQLFLCHYEILSWYLFLWAESDLASLFFPEKSGAPVK